MARLGTGIGFRRYAARWAGPVFLWLLGMAVATGLGGAAAQTVDERAGHAAPSKLAAKSLLLDVARAGARLVAVGEFGHVVYSDDGGESWTQAADVPTQVTLTSIQFVNELVGFAGGHDTTVLKTEDGGVTWTLAYHDRQTETPIMTVLFDTEAHGWVMGAFSFVMETFDGGQTWEPRQLVEGSEDDYHLNKAFQAKDRTIFVAAEFGTVYRSTDGGQRFEAVQTPYQGSFWGGLGIDDGSVLLYGMRGTVYRTDDQGARWTKVETGTAKSFGGGVQLSNGTIILVGLGGAVAYSTDRGRRFTTVTQPDGLGYSAVAEGTGKTIVIFGESGVHIMANDAAAAGGG